MKLRKPFAIMLSMALVAGTRTIAWSDPTPEWFELNLANYHIWEEGDKGTNEIKVSVDLPPGSDDYVHGNFVFNAILGRQDVNHDPLPTQTDASTDVNTPLTFSLPIKDVDDDTLSYSLISAPAAGSVAIAAGQVTFTPDSASANRVLSFALLALDGRGGYAYHVYNITVDSPTDLVPTAAGNTYATAYGDELNFDLSYTGEPFRILPPARGSAVVSGNAVTYTPSATNLGNDLLVYMVTYGANTVAALVKLNVAPPTVALAQVHLGSAAGPVVATIDPTYGTSAVTLPTTNIPDGFQTLVVVAQDASGGSSVVTFSIRIDNTAPSCIYKTPDTPLDNAWVAGNVSFTVTADDQMSGVQGVALDLGVPPPYVRVNGTLDWQYDNFNTLLLSDGSQDFLTRCYDRANNVSELTRTLRVDNTAPSVSPSFTPPAISNLVRGVEVLNVNADDGSGSGVVARRFKLDGVQLATSFPYNFNTVVVADGDHTLTVEGTDAVGNTATASQSIAIDNTAPTISITSPSVATVVLGTLSQIQATITEANGISEKTISIDGTPMSFTESGNTYTLAVPVNTNGAHTIVFQAKDTVGNQGSTSRVFVLSGTSNHAPIAQSLSRTLAEDNSAALTMVASDPDRDAISYSIVSAPSHGVLSGLSSANVTYTPSVDYNGSDSFTYKANDGSLDSNTATFSLMVMPVNDAPVAMGLAVNTLQNTSLPIVLGATDADGDTLSYFIVSQPLHGTLSGSGTNVTYTPSSNYYGADSFTFKANDGTVNSNLGTISITVTHVNQAPVATPQYVQTPKNIARSVTLSGTDADGDPLTYALVANPSHGTLSGTVPNLTYTPALDYVGNDILTFKANDGFVDSAVAAVNLNIFDPTTRVNNPPTVANQVVIADEDTPKSILLAAADLDGDPLTISVVASPSHGTLSGSMPNLTYTPALHYHGSDLFTFKANDGFADSNLGTVSITVNHLNHAPNSHAQSVSTAKNNAKTVVLTGDDVDGDSLSYAIVAGPTHGTLTGTPPSITYTPALNYVGADAITFKTNDGQIDGNTAAVSITVQAVNNAPVANDGTASTNKNAAVVIAVVATDIDQDPLTYAIVNAPAHGTLSGSGPNFTYTPALDFSGLDSFTFKANDGVDNSNSGTLSILVNAVNTPPSVQFLNPVNGSSIGSVIQLSVLATDDGGMNGVTFSVNGGASQAMTHSSGNVWVANLNTNPLPQGSATILVTAQDLTSQTTTASVTVTIDNTLPTIPSSTLPSGNTSGTFAISANGGDNNGISQLQILIDGNVVTSVTPPNGSTSANVTYSWNTGSVGNGSHVVTILVIDLAGNTKTLSSNVIVNNGPAGLPVVTILTPKTNDAISAVSSLEMTVDGEVTSAGFRIDGGSLLPATLVAGTNKYKTNLNTTVYADGYHNIDFVATNGAGSTFQTAQVFFDNTAPILSVTAPTANQQIFSIKNLVADASDSSGLPLTSVRMSLGASPLAFFPGHTNVTDHIYSYTLDTTALADGNYSLLVVARDRAGNESQTTVPFRIDNANVPLSNATVSWTPAASFVVGSAAAMVSATISNASIDPVSITDAGLRVIITKDGMTSAWAGPVQLNGSTVKYLATIPANARVHCVLNILDTTGKVIRQTHDFISAMDQKVGGSVTILPESSLRFSVPADGLTEDALVEMIKLDANQASQVSLNDGQQTVYGPIQIRAINAAGDELAQLKNDAQIWFQRPVSEVSPTQGDQSIDRAQMYVRGSREYWKSLGAGGNSGVSKDDSPGAVRTITVPVNQFGIFRITAEAIPGEGVTNLINLPNPFSPSHGGTDFSYLLGADSDVNLVLYDLLGNLVLRSDFGAGSQGGRFGQNTVHWDGRNGVGEVVANGGYILQITAKDASGDVMRARVKVAVVK